MELKNGVVEELVGMDMIVSWSEWDMDIVENDSGSIQEARKQTCGQCGWCVLWLMQNM